MADHARTQCRDAAVTLVTGLTTTGTRVFAARPESHPLQAAELPCLLVYTDDEQSEFTAGARGSRRKERACDLVIHGVAQDKTDLDKKLDTIAKEVEAALEANPTLNGKAKDLWHLRTKKMSSAQEGKAPTGEIEITFRCEYDTREAIPDALLA